MKIVRENLKVSSRELYYSLKKEYKHCLIIVKEKLCYKTFDEDAKIMWYIFHYKYSDNVVIFGNKAFDKVVNKLKSLNIRFVIVSKIEELLSYGNDDLGYLSYYDLSQKAYCYVQKEKQLISRMKTLLANHLECYNDICTFFDNMEKNIIE